MSISSFHRSTSSLGRIHLKLILSLAVLVAAVWWVFFSGTVPVRHLGPATSLLARPGCPLFAVQIEDRTWKLFDTAARRSGDGRVISGQVEDFPALTQEGVVVWSDSGLRRVSLENDEVLLPVEAFAAPARFLGVAGESDAVFVTEGDAAELWVVGLGDDVSGIPWRLEGRDEETTHRIDGPVLLSPFGRSLTFIGEKGREAWSWDEQGKSKNVVAEGFDRPAAVFAEDGKTLVLEGSTDDLRLFSLETGSLGFMAEGNLGWSRRVDSSHGFRGAQEERQLFVPRWFRNGYLQLFHTHFKGGGTHGFKLGFLHHYGVTVSENGASMAYLQADFDEESDNPFTEEIYHFDFNRVSRGAVFLGKREGGLRHAGPTIVGRGQDLVFLLDGEVRLLPGAQEQAP